MDRLYKSKFSYITLFHLYLHYVIYVISMGEKKSFRKRHDLKRKFPLLVKSCWNRERKGEDDVELKLY